jgi:hypothetical protein
MRNLRCSYAWFRICQARPVLGCLPLADTGGLAVPSPRELQGKKPRRRGSGRAARRSSRARLVFNDRRFEVIASSSLPNKER